MLPWQVFDLVSHHLDPKTLAVASCVCKSWFACFSSDHVWHPICTTHFPSLSNLKLTNAALSYYRLYAMASAAAKRRFQSPSKPSLALHNLIFAVNVFNHNNVLIVSLEKPGDELVVDDNGVFKFDIDVDNYEYEGVVLESVRVTWNVVLKGWRGVFNMLECQGKKGVDWWFWEELPLPGCCASLVDSGVVADLRLEFTDDSKRGQNNVDHVGRINKVSVGMLSTTKLRYVGVDDGLRYLQHFLYY
ncbi:PREDICTED: probable F-box protein At5g04010 [Fragaria vesca subsp. vesca]|uniref:probable F-box protein At5g04010 n=1 Tax=Fragaria vesca subsp. vesca TaxID=101020 RepID=UPI0002C31963|nr:PREDICTED: probable F-box protein At5g04010 [Fragaria vesca subsp. vesca]